MSFNLRFVGAAVVGAIAAAGALAIAFLGGAAAPVDANPGDRYQVWFLDQQNSSADKAYGGFIKVYNQTDLERSGAQAVPQTYDLGGQPSELCKEKTGAYPVRPHMLAFNGGDRYGRDKGRFAVISWVVSGHVTIHDAKTREALACFQTEAGAGGARQAHAAWPTPDQRYLVVANQNGKKLERIRTDYAKKVFTQEPGATLSLYEGKTPSGADRQDQTLRPDNAPICVRPTYDGKYSFVSLRGGGAFVVNHRTTPVSIIAEYDRTAIRDNGCGQVEARGKFFVNSGADAFTGTSPGAGQSYSHDLYAVTLSKIKKGGNAPNTPAPRAIYRFGGNGPDGAPLPGPTVVDGHGLAVLAGERVLVAGDRARGDIRFIDTKSERQVRILSLNREGAPEAPDLFVDSPDGRFLFATLRGPTPLSGGHPAKGTNPGLAIIRLGKAGKSGELVGIAPARRDDALKPDPHGIGLRIIPPAERR